MAEKPPRLRMSRKPIEKGKHWTDKDRLKVIAAFSLLGNASRVEEVTGVPAPTINFWKTQPWWFEEMEKLRKSEDEAMLSGYGKIMRKTIELLEKRLDDGDIVILRDGSKTNKPVPARELAQITTAATNARQKIRSESLDNTLKSITVQDRLNALKEQFISFTKGQTIDGQVISKEVTYEKDDVREEGTQEGRKERNEDVKDIQNQNGEEGRTQEREMLNAVSL